MSQSGALLKTLTPTVAPVWIGYFTLDRTVPNRIWVVPSTGGNNSIHYCSFDTSANSYTILATFNQPTGGGGYPGGSWLSPARSPAAASSTTSGAAAPALARQGPRAGGL